METTVAGAWGLQERTSQNRRLTLYPWNRASLKKGVDR